MNNQLSFSCIEFAAKKKITRRERFLAEMEELVPWAELVSLRKPMPCLRYTINFLGIFGSGLSRWHFARSSEGGSSQPQTAWPEPHQSKYRFLFRCPKPSSRGDIAESSSKLMSASGSGMPGDRKTCAGC